MAVVLNLGSDSGGYSLDASREWFLLVGAVRFWDGAGMAGANREGGAFFGEVMVVSLALGERTVAIGGGVAPCWATEDVVERGGDKAAVDSEGGSRAR